MLRSILSLKNFTMRASDGEIGKVKDFYFDDQTWRLKYLVVETGNWLMGKKVLISTAALHAPIWNESTFPVDLTIDQVKNSPDIDTEKPVTREQEYDLNYHYSWPWDGGGIGFMTTGMVGGVVAPDIPLSDRVGDEMHHAEHQHRDKHLRSFKQVHDFELRCTDKNIGEVHDFLMSDSDWSLPYIVAEAGNWYAGKKLLLATRFVDKIEWETSSVYLLQSSAQVANATEFDYENLNDDGFNKQYESSYSDR